MSRYSAIKHLIGVYPQWPVGRLTEDCPIEAVPEFERWRWLLDPDGELIFTNGMDPAITIDDYLTCKGVYNVTTQ